jgi:hypothetical protein
MTKKNLMILNRIRQEVNSSNSRFLFVVRTPQIARINLTVLRILMADRKERGIYISIDKPDKHVKQILERHNISHEGSYVDTGVHAEHAPEAISAPMEAANKILVVSGIFCPTLFLDSIDATMASSPEAKARIVGELKTMNFIMVDNVSTMIAYNSNAKIHEFFVRFDAFLKQFPNIRAFLSTDKNLPTDIYQAARKAVDREVEILDEWL